MNDEELIEKINNYYLYLDDKYLKEPCQNLLKIQNLNIFFEKYFKDEYQAFTSFIIDSVRHSHSYRESIIKKFEDEKIYLFFEKHLYDSSVDIRRNSLIILCDTLNIHRKNCKKVLEGYFFQVLRNDPLLMYDYISEFLWLYAYDSKMKNKLFSNIFNENEFITNICLLEYLESFSTPLLSKSGFKKYILLRKLQKNKNSFVSEYAENIKKFMQNRKPDVTNQKCIIQNARNEFWNKLAINNKTEYSADEYKTFIVEYIKKNT